MYQYKWTWLVISLFVLNACSTSTTSDIPPSTKILNLISCIVLLVLVGGLVMYMSRARSGTGESVSNFYEAKASLKPLFDKYYKPASPLTPNEQEVINSQRDSLERAISSFQSARELELSGTAFGGGTFGKWTLPLFPNELTACLVCDTRDSFVKYQQLDHAHKIRCSKCRTAFNVDERPDSSSGLVWVRVLAMESESRNEISQMPRKYIVTAQNRREAAVALHEIGMVHRLLGDLDQAKSVLLQAYTETEELYSEFGKYSPALANDLAVNSFHLGDVEHLSGNLDTAIEWYEKSIPLFEVSGDKNNLQLVRDVLSTISQQKEG